MLPTLSVANKTNKDDMDALCGATVVDKTMYVVGGLGHNIVLQTTTGATFKKIGTKGRGLRGIHVDERGTWICGEYGTLYRSTRGVSSFKQLKLATGVCLFTITRAVDGTYWIGGEDGFLARSDNGVKWTKVAGLRGTVGKLVATEAGTYIPTLDGLYIANGTKLRKLGLPRPVNHLVVTREDTLVAVGVANSIYRSVDGGVKFKPAKKPAFAAAKVPASRRLSRPYWIGQSKDINVIAELGDGRLVAAGDQGVILASDDDGKTFQKVPNALFAGSIWGIAAFRGDVYLAGEAKTILRVR
ncbi:MAG: hypothetical protein ACKV2T_06130 [Kofleriaceae bacterium]